MQMEAGFLQMREPTFLLDKRDRVTASQRVSRDVPRSWGVQLGSLLRCHLAPEAQKQTAPAGFYSATDPSPNPPYVATLTIRIRAASRLAVGSL